MQSPYLTVALKAVKAAEAVVLRYFTSGITAELKEDSSPVTVADQEAEELIIATIKRAFPSHTFYGEEGGKIDLSNHRGFTWIIDPIDGTKNYIRGLPLFATQLALLHDNEFILGVSNAPLMHELMYAEKGHGCFLNNEPVQVAKTTNLQEAYISYGAIKYFSAQQKLAQLATLTEQTRWARGIGDFWSYHLLAQGKIDIMIEAGTKIWDIAALKVIIEEAGGRVSQLDGRPISTTSTSIVATNGLLQESVLALLKK
jgi:histidinol-phosphatase